MSLTLYNFAVCKNPSVIRTELKNLLSNKKYVFFFNFKDLTTILFFRFQYVASQYVFIRALQVFNLVQHRNFYFEK